MRWGTWARKPAEAASAALGLDLNAGRARAVAGPPSGAAPHVVPLDSNSADLPLLISLENRTPVLGSAAYEFVRLLPHAVCRDFLSAVGQAREWRTPQCRLNAAGAVALVAAHMKGVVPAGHAVVLVVPPYLSDQQVALITDAFVRAGISIVGSAAMPLALAATCDAGFGTALVLDADEHALTWSVLAADGPNARLLAHHAVPGASVRAWHDRLIDAVSDRCVRVCRRDPRDSAAAEQSLFEQIDSALSARHPHWPVTLQIRTSQWFQELSVTLDDFESFAAPLARIAVDAMRQVAVEAHATAPVMARPDLLWITADAARLPGLSAAATQNVPESTVVQTLPADAIASAGYLLGGHYLRGDLASGPIMGIVPRFARESGPVSGRSDAARGRSRRI
jgi:hypothetical protein